MTVIGITGIIGTGKTTAAKYIAEKYDYVLIEADIVGHDILTPSPSPKGEGSNKAYKQVIKEFGTVDRKVLGGIVFSDPGKLKKLEEIMHPEMFRLIEKSVNYLNEQGKNTVIEAAVLHKMGLDKLCDKVIVLKSSEEIIKKRLLEKGLSENQIVTRSKNAPVIPEEEVIQNNTSTEDLYKQLDKII